MILLFPAPTHCLICERLLDDPSDPVRSRDCGGDCLECMADCGDPYAVAAIREIDPNNEIATE